MIETIPASMDKDKTNAFKVEPCVDPDDCLPNKCPNCGGNRISASGGFVIEYKFIA